ncbi:MAG: hypothetical protein LBS11_00110 [Oscillospiraceae bacterium]|nr:hypothetical protein [Oscillospiraceae bacterium]
MNAQGRSQRPGTNAPREESAARSALTRRDEGLRTPSFIRFGRAEEAAREAEQREAAKRAVARQAQLNAYEAEMERMRQASSVPAGSAIPSADSGLRAASGDAYGTYSPYPDHGYSGASAARASSVAAAAPKRKYPAPYASGAAGGVSAPRSDGRQRLNRAASTSAALRTDGGARESSRMSPRRSRQRARRRIPLLFFCLPLAMAALVRTLVFGASVEAVIRGGIQSSAALNQFIMDNHIELTAVLPGSAWTALRWFMASLCAGFFFNALAWYNSGKPMALLAVAGYAAALITAPWRNYAPTIALTVLPALVFSALSFYALVMSPPPRKASQPVRGRRPAQSRSGQGVSRFQ